MAKHNGDRERAIRHLGHDILASRERTLREEFPEIWADPRARDAALYVHHVGWEEPMRRRKRRHGASTK